MEIGLGGWNNVYDVEGVLQNFSPNSGVISIPGEEFFMKLRTEQDMVRAYNSCPPIKAILGKRAKMANTGKFEVLNTNNGNYAKGEDARAIKRLLVRPNALQTGRQFFAQQNTYVDLFGYCPVLGVESVGFEGQGYSSIWNIPPWLFDLEYTGDWLGQTSLKSVFKKFKMLWAGGIKELKVENLHFIYDDGIGTEYDSNLLIPDARLIGCDYIVSNLIAALKSRNTLITKRGAIGILSNAVTDSSGPMPFVEGEKERVQREFKNYGIVGQPFQIIITEAALKWQQMGFPTKDLLLFEEGEENINQLCDTLGWYPELLGRTKGVTFDNKKQAQKSAYRDIIIPESDSRMEQFSPIVVPPDRTNFVVVRDFSGVPVLQEDAKQEAEALKVLNEALAIEYDNNLITRNDWREEIGKDRLPNPEFDKYKNELTSASPQEDANNNPDEDGNIDPDSPKN